MAASDSPRAVGAEKTNLGEALRVPDDILLRMQAHQDKQSAMLRPLRLARGH